MSDELHDQLAAYDRAVSKTTNIDRSLSEGERWALGIAAPQLAAHTPSDRVNPTCTGCPGEPWPCSTASGAMVMADSRYN
ncbi:hypothetical protein OG693_39075 (plasmid) [Streptomyces sp. NBC_01259]|uniref:hypothetical protein n=1 Tax=Streptomyces sp. NBC_01259 TaxID=2903800 RepID=UPI002F90BF71